jgi:hypothetical protein
LSGTANIKPMKITPKRAKRTDAWPFLDVVETMPWVVKHNVEIKKARLHRIY